LDKHLTGSLFPKGSVRGKSDSQMQGDQYIIGALDINATIRAYQVLISHETLARSYILIYIDVCFFYLICLIKGSWPFDSRHRSIGHTKSGIGKVTRHREPAASDRCAAASQRNDWSRHEQGIPPRVLDRYRRW